MNDGCLNSVVVIKVNISGQLKIKTSWLLACFFFKKKNPTSPPRQRERWLELPGFSLCTRDT